MNNWIIVGIVIAVLSVGILALSGVFAQEKIVASSGQTICSAGSCSGQCTGSCNAGATCGCSDCAAKTVGSCGCGK